MSAPLEEILSELNEYGGFKASLIINVSGAIVAAKLSEKLDENAFTSLGMIISDFTKKIGETLKLSHFVRMKIEFQKEFLLIHSIRKPKTEEDFYLIIFTEPPESRDIDLYFDQLVKGIEIKIKSELK